MKSQEDLPMSKPVLIEIELNDHICVLRCHGPFVSGRETEYMQTKLDEIKRMACTRVLADFEHVSSIGSMGVGFLVGAYTSVVKKPGGRFLLAGASPSVRHVLDLTRLNTIIPQASDFPSGLALLSAGINS